MITNDTQQVVAFPLSFAQRALWLMYELQPDSSVYHVPFSVRIEGDLDQTSLKRSLEEVISRHEVLRTTFVKGEDETHQIIHTQIELPFINMDWQAEYQDHRNQKVLQFLEEESRRPFDLRTSPPIRCTLIREAQDRHVLLLTLHHIACDGWSLPILLKELSVYFAAFQQNHTLKLPELPIQYGDYAVWQRQQAEQQLYFDSLAYWEQQLGGLSPLAVPTDRRPKQLSFRGAALTILLPHELAATAEEFSLRENATLFMTLLAAFKELLHRYTGQSDIVVGSPVANRNHADIENLVGFFVNQIALRTDVSSDPTFRELLRRVRQVCLDAFSHQDVPFEMVAERCDPRHTVNRHPLFQHMFMLHSLPSDLLSFPDLTVTPLHVERKTSKFELTWNIYKNNGSYALEIEYNTDLFERAAVEYMARHFQLLLSGMLADPDSRVSEIKMSDEIETHQLLNVWNDTATEFPADACVHELFEAQVDHLADSVAIIDGERLLTYSELNHRSNQLAGYLIDQGIVPDTPVGLFLEKSAEIYIGMLAVLKAGGAYVPLDPDAPIERLNWILKDIGTPVVLTTTNLENRLPQHTSQLWCFDRAEHWRAITEYQETNLFTEVTSNHLAYILYTSGSTGTPKGVAVPHQAISRLVIKTNYVQLDATDRVAQVLNLSFDGSTFETWGALLHGARLVAFPKSLLLSPEELVAQLESHQINVMLLTTTLFNLIARHAPQAFHNMRNVLFGGEAVTPSYVRSVLETAPPRRLLHIYGPTETTTFASWHLVESVAEEATNVPIGRGISSTQLYLLDHRFELTPIGVAGELYIGGDGLARGYHNGASLTAQQFIPNPFSNDHADRLYKSGDLCRWRSDGSIEFLSRIDHQLKVRGIRTEPGEIESALMGHPDISVAIVTTSKGDSERKRLIAYFVPHDRARPKIAELRQFLARKLHESMMPSAFVPLDRLPLNSSGKVDRNRLPAPKEFHLSADKAYVAPQTPTEVGLTVIWRQVLNLRKIGTDDEFLEIGGNSQLASQLIFRVEETFQVEIPLVAVYDNSTIAELAVFVEQSRTSGDKSET